MVLDRCLVYSLLWKRPRLHDVFTCTSRQLKHFASLRVQLEYHRPSLRPPHAQFKKVCYATYAQPREAFWDRHHHSVIGKTVVRFIIFWDGVKCNSNWSWETVFHNNSLFIFICFSLSLTSKTKTFKYNNSGTVYCLCLWKKIHANTLWRKSNINQNCNIRLGVRGV